MANPKTTALTREAAWKAKQMYEEKDERGRKVWTIMKIADFFGVGETTAYRAIKSVGPYQSLPEVKPPDVLHQEAKESEQRLLKMLSGEIPAEPAEPKSVLDRMSRAIHERNADALTKELEDLPINDEAKKSLVGYLGGKKDEPSGE